MANHITNLRDDDLIEFLDLLAQQAPAYAAQLGLSAQEVQDIQDAASGFAQAHQDAFAALAEYRGKIEAKDDARQGALDTVRPLVNMWKADGSVGEGLLQTLGVSPDRKRRRSVPVFTPSNLLARQSAAGNTVSWDPNGNEYRTNYVVESRTRPDGPWRFVAVTTSTRYFDSGASLGETVYYRVRAERSGRASTPTAPTIAGTSLPSLQAA